MSGSPLVESSIINATGASDAHCPVGYEIACGCGADSPEDRILYVKIFTITATVAIILTLGVYGLVSRLG